MSKGLQCWFSELEEKNVSLSRTVANISALCCVNVLTFLLNLLANTFVVYKFYQTSARQPVSNTLLLLLSSLDLFKGIVAQPLLILVILFELYGRFNCTLRNITEAIHSIFLGNAFLFVTVVITSERFFAILYPLYHRVYMRKKLLIYSSLTLFITWAILAVTFHTVWYFSNLYLVYLSVLSVGLVYTLCVYVKIFRVSRNSQKSLIQRRDTARSRHFGPLSNENLAKGEIIVGYRLPDDENKKEGIKIDSGVNIGKIEINIKHQ